MPMPNHTRTLGGELNAMALHEKQLAISASYQAEPKDEQVTKTLQDAAKKFGKFFAIKAPDGIEFHPSQNCDDPDGFRS